MHFLIHGHDEEMKSDIEWVWNYLKPRDKNMIYVIKNSVGEVIIRLGISEDEISMLKDRAIENVTIEAQVLKNI